MDKLLDVSEQITRSGNFKYKSILNTFLIEPGTILWPAQEKKVDKNYSFQGLKIGESPQDWRLSHTAAITKTITITTQRACILLVVWASAYSAWSNSTNRMCSLCVVIFIVIAIAAVWLCLYRLTFLLGQNLFYMTGIKWLESKENLLRYSTELKDSQLFCTQRCHTIM